MKRAALGALMVLLAAGCSGPQDLERVNREQYATIQSLNEELKRLNAELDQALHNRTDLQNTREGLENRMQDEIASGDVTVGMESRGLVVTVLDRVLFDSGRADLKPSSLETLSKLADTFAAELAGHMIYIEGHTDDQPIRFSNWRSNWELSMARAMEVLHYFGDQKGLDPRGLAATGYGEYQPVASNGDPEGRSKNRRVEIVVSPKKIAGR